MSEIYYIDKDKEGVQKEHVPGNRTLRWLYNSTTGRLSLHLLVKRKLVSSMGGWYMNSKMSKTQIRKFIEKYDLDLSIYENGSHKDYRNFNHFFARKLKKDARPIGHAVVSPADGKILAFQNLNEVSAFFVKGSEFSVRDYFQDDALTDKYKDGAMAIIRLAPTDYHRFHFPYDGIISESKRIKGRYFSVSPIALKKSLEIFCQNHRVHSTLKTQDHGDILMTEVGATMVGSIKQTYEANTHVVKGAEKGYFAFGGSTVILFFEKDKVTLDPELLENTKDGLETKVNVGESIAY